MFISKGVASHVSHIVNIQHIFSSSLLQILASLLYQAARECHCVDPDKVKNALNPSQEKTPVPEWINELPNGQLSHQEIQDLASAITVSDMEIIAEGYMDIDPETIKNLYSEYWKDPNTFKLEIITRWFLEDPELHQKKVFFTY